MIWQALETPFLLEWQLYLQPHIHTLWFIFYMCTRPSRFGIYPFHPLARINFSHEKEFFSRQKVGRKIVSNAGVSAHLPGQGHRGMGNPSPCIRAILLHLSTLPTPGATPPTRATCSSLKKPESCFGWREVQNSWATSHKEKTEDAFNSYSFERVQKIAKLLKKIHIQSLKWPGNNNTRAELSEGVLSSREMLLS